MQQIKFFCDIDQKEIQEKDGIATLQGVIVKMNAQLEKQNHVFQGHYCSECAETILNFIVKFKEEHGKYPDTNPMVEQAKPGGSDK